MNLPRIIPPPRRSPSPFTRHQHRPRLAHNACQYPVIFIASLANPKQRHPFNLHVPLCAPQHPEHRHRAKNPPHPIPSFFTAHCPLPAADYFLSSSGLNSLCPSCSLFFISSTVATAFTLSPSRSCSSRSNSCRISLSIILRYSLTNLVL